jgi:lipopolysaccharide export system protein LptA
MLNDKRKINFRNRHSILLAGILCLFSVCVAAQTPAGGQEQQPEKKKTRVDLLHADVGYANRNVRSDVQVLVGDVRMKHEGMFMWCDSALIYESTNSIEAFGNVRMEQGDTLFIYGDYLFYDGMAQLAQLRENVKMINRNINLMTDSLNYDRVFNLGYYFEGGMLTDEENVLTSDWGEYSPATKLSVFNHEVTLVNPRFTLTSDTLKYHTETKIATILGPSEIVSDQNHIYSERGFYDTAHDVAELLDRSVLTNEGKRLVGDSLFYDRKIGFGEAFDHVVMNDTINKNMLTGDYCLYDEPTGYAMATKQAVAIDYSQGDSLFIHGDTLKMLTFHIDTDSLFREVRAYHKVRMYRTDVQGVCDSLVFNSKDSCITMYTDPILWNERQQLLGEEIRIYMNDSTIDWAHIINQALTVEMKDSLHYNQITGKEIKAYFEEGQMHKIDVIGNVLVVYYPEEKDSTIIGMNTSETSLLNIYLHERKIEKMVMSPKSNGTLYPMDQLPADKMKLPNFQWFDYIRPINKDDIFDWRPKRAGDILRKTTRQPVSTPVREIKNSK